MDYSWRVSSVGTIVVTAVVIPAGVQWHHGDGVMCYGYC